MMSESSETTERLPEEDCNRTVSVFIGRKQELMEKKKKKCNVNGRDIVIFYHNGAFYAMDQRCYRM